MLWGCWRKWNIYRYRFRPGHGHDPRDRIGVVAEELPDEVSTLDHKGAPTGELIALSLASNRALVEKVKQLEEVNRRQEERLRALERKLQSIR
jgi:hypothetical protein